VGALVKALEARPDAGMCASQVRLECENLLDSAGMLIRPTAAASSAVTGSA